jgi:hypothetical protein
MPEIRILPDYDADLNLSRRGTRIMNYKLQFDERNLQGWNVCVSHVSAANTFRN